MQRRRLDDPAKRSWWLVHFEAHRKSGLTAAEYCKEHGLSAKTFAAWRHVLTDWEERKRKQNLARKLHYRPISQDRRRQATQAFWAMHVEAWQWSGLHLRDYSSALRLSPHSLKRWRNLIESEEVMIDWRSLLHPSARPPISTGISPSAKEKTEAARLTAALEADAPPRKKATRRRWSTEEKIAILLQAERDGSTISSVGQALGISASVLFRWRDQFGMGREKPAVIMPVRVAEQWDRKVAGRPSLLADLLPRPDGMIELELGDGRRVFAPEGSDPETVEREVAARERLP